MMTTLEKMEALRMLATRNYSKWTRKALAENWKIIGDAPIYGVHKAELIEMTVERELDTQITEPGLTEGWRNQVDYWLDLLINELDFEDKVDLIASGLIRNKWRAGL